MPPLAAALKTKFDDNDPNIEVVALVGKIPQTPSPEQQQQLLRSINGRMITYDTLIQEALDSYKDYLEADERVSRLNTILYFERDLVHPACSRACLPSEASCRQGSV